jgi:lysozyme family protein
MSGTFEAWVAMVLAHEGGYCYDSQDPGGETKYGITQRAYPALDIAALTEAEARAIYQRDYWDRIRGDDLPPPVAFCVGDMAVNAGVLTAVTQLQRALGLRADGIVGAETIRVAYQADLRSLLDVLTELRVEHYMTQPAFNRYGAGWVNRAFATVRAARQLEMA